MLGTVAPSKLFPMCVSRTCDLLMSGAWDGCEENPFSSVPTSVVQNLLSCMWPTKSKLSSARIVHSHLLLTSDRLEHVDLLHAKYFEHYVPLLRMLSRGCQNLRSLSLPGCGPPEPIERTGSDEQRALQELLQACPNLEDLHSPFFFGPGDVRNCTRLKRLRFHFIMRNEELLAWVSSDFLQRSLEVFSFCGIDNDPSESRISATVALLDRCSELVSLGFLDSSVALKRMHDRDCGTPPTTRRSSQLRRCYWGGCPIPKKYSSEFGHCDMIRDATQTCPLVEVLVMKVREASTLQHLKTLRNLTFLDVDFYDCADDYEREFDSLLRETGHQLRHLSVSGSGAKGHNLNVICHSCPNLTTLLLNCGITVDEPAESDVNLLHLERLNVRICNRESLFFLLSNSIRLQVLCLEYSDSLDDGLLHEILGKNPFSELEVAIVFESYLSESGLARFFGSARKLRKCSLGSYVLDDDEVKRCLNEVNPGAVYHPSDDYFEPEQEEFPQTTDECCWL